MLVLEGRERRKRRKTNRKGRRRTNRKGRRKTNRRKTRKKMEIRYMRRKRR